MDNHFESLRIIVDTIPHSVASAPEIKSMLTKIDSDHNYILSGTRDKEKQLQQKHGLLVKLTHFGRCGVTFEHFGDEHPPQHTQRKLKNSKL